MSEMEECVTKPTILQQLYSKTCGAFESCTEYVASFAFGQYILKTSDKILWILEKSFGWYLPKNADNNDCQTDSDQIRPLPWIPFLILLVILRIFKIYLNIFMFCVGAQMWSVEDIVKTIQVGRRRIRALKFQGLRQIRQRKSQIEFDETVVSWKETIYNNISKVMCARSQSFNDASEKIVANNSDTQVTKKCPNINFVKPDLMFLDENNDKLLMERIRELVNTESEDDSDYVRSDEDEEESSCEETSEPDKEAKEENITDTKLMNGIIEKDKNLVTDTIQISKERIEAVACDSDESDHHNSDEFYSPKNNKKSDVPVKDSRSITAEFLDSEKDAALKKNDNCAVKSAKELNGSGLIMTTRLTSNYTVPNSNTTEDKTSDITAEPKQNTYRKANKKKHKQKRSGFFRKKKK